MDASAIPEMISGDIQAAVMVLANKGATLVLEDWIRRLEARNHHSKKPQPMPAKKKPVEKPKAPE